MEIDRSGVLLSVEVVMVDGERGCVPAGVDFEVQKKSRYTTG